jgi:hypothetical protein
MEQQTAMAQQMLPQPTQTGIPVTQSGGNTSLENMFRTMAQGYGLSLPRGNLVDASGNILITPDQLQGASGGTETLGTASAKLGYISDALTRRLNEQQQEKARSAVATGIGQVQQRGRGSLASLQMGAYRDMADLYANQEYQAADFSYFIQKEQQDIAMALEKQRQEREKSSGVLGGIMSGAGLGSAFGPLGAVLGGVAGGVLGFGAEEGWF